MTELQCRALKERATLVMEIASELNSLETKDKRAVSIAITHLQTAGMWIRAGAYGTTGRID